MTTPRKTYVKRLHWTSEMNDTLCRLYPGTKAAAIAELLGCTAGQVYDRARRLGLYKTREALAEMARKTMQNPHHPAHGTRFAKGGTPWNKGINYNAGGRSRETQFKAGHRRGAAAHNWAPIGTERINDEGYLERKMTDTGITRRDFVPVHRLIWIEAGREIPPGYSVCFKDGDRKNVVLDNLELRSRAEIMRRNSIHNYGPEIARISQLKGALQRQINKIGALS